VEIFSDSADEGRFFEASVTADASTGSFLWVGSPAGPNLTATASNVFLGSTSQFSSPYVIGVCNNPPTAAFSFSPNNVNKCTTIAFDASTSSDTEDALSALQVRWDWENDGTFDTSLSDQKTAEHLFNTSGLHSVRLEVQDSGGLTDSATQQVTITAESCGGVYLPLVIR
jgi:PKD repeat protein